ncbi:MAG: hypothetical protein MRY83_10500 [Flavobacteriales bacterium]|nr:hypothetical protein [Flavobacteriales bacterium]
MNKLYFGLCLYMLPILSTGQNKDFQSTPESVMEEIFRAARENDFSNLHKLCPPKGGNDGDTRDYICNVAESKEIQKEYVSYFAKGKLNGEIKYGEAEAGTESATVPFWFNHPGGESRSNETMMMTKINGKWYIMSF